MTVSRVEMGRYLILSLQHEQIGDFAKWKAEGDDLSLIDVIGELADMYNSRWNTGTSDVPFELLAVVAVGCEENRRSDGLQTQN